MAPGPHREPNLEGMRKHFLTLIALSLAAGVAVKGAQFGGDRMPDHPAGCRESNAAFGYPHSPGSHTANDAWVVPNVHTSGTAFGGMRGVVVTNSNGIPYLVHIRTQSAEFVGQTMPALDMRITMASHSAGGEHPAEAPLLSFWGLASLMFLMAGVAVFTSRRGSSRDARRSGIGAIG